MASLTNEKSFVALLNCLKKRLFEGDTSITNELIGEQLFGNGDPAEVEAEIGSIEELLRRAAEGNWEVSKMENVLNRVGNFTPQQMSLCIAWWTNKKEKIHSSVILKTIWNNTLKQLSWRVDIKTASKSAPEVNEPIALFEIATSGSQAKFEISKPQLDSILEQLDECQKRISSF